MLVQFLQIHTGGKEKMVPFIFFFPIFHVGDGHKELQWFSAFSEKQIALQWYKSDTAPQIE